MTIFCLPIASFMFWIFTVSSFSVFRLWHTYAHSHPNGGWKRRHYQPKNGYIWLKTALFKLNFRDEGHLYSNCLFVILTFIPNTIFFSSLSVPILAGGQNGCISLKNKQTNKKTARFCKNIFFLRLYFRDECHEYSNFLFYILNIYLKCFPL